MNAPAQIARNDDSALEYALGYAARGLKIFPIRAGHKGETVNGRSTHILPNGHNGATCDLATVRRWWTEYPNTNIGLNLAASGLVAVDADTYKPDCGFAAFMQGREMPATWEQQSPRGGRHYIFTAEPGSEFLGRLCEGVDIKHKGYILLEPSTFEGKAYRRETDDAPAPCPDFVPRKKLSERAMPPALQIDTGRTFDFSGRGADAAEVREILGWINPDSGYSDWLAVLIGLHDHFNGSAEGLEIADEWSSRGAKYRAGEVAAKWRGFTIGGGAGWGGVCALARQAGADLAEIARRHRGRPADDLARDFPPPALPDGPKPVPAAPAKRKAWCADLACTTLETDPAWRGVLAFDEFAGLTMLLLPMPGTTVPKASFKPRPICDTDFTAAVRWFNRNGYPDATRNTVTDAVYLVAGQTVISPVRHYLESLQWDGTPRAGDWLARYCGAVPSDLTRKVGQAWLISAVARALSPGCKADCALVLEGPQGAGKSSVLRALAGEAWFHDGLPDMHGKDASAALRGKWIIELPELAAMRRTDAEAVKAFLSRSEERYRPPYGRAEVVEPRRCVFAGTTNRADYLNDDTGGRRFWPVTVGSIDLNALTRDRDQLWAEAVELYRGGAHWWLDAEAEAEAAAVVSTRAADDPWTADVLAAVSGMAECSARDVFQLLNIDRDRWSRADAMRLAGVLTRAGWTRRGKFTGGPNRDLARYVAPSGDSHA